MKIIKDTELINNIKLNNTAVAVGKFDGVHIGHELIMRELKLSKNDGMATVVFTFSDSPRNVVDNEDAKYITVRDEKYRLYEKHEVDYVIEYPMTKELINMTREEFLENILIKRLGMKRIICGDDFRFGYKRLGDVKFLEDNAREFGYTVDVISKLKVHNENVSSTLIRDLIKKGDVCEAGKLLGHPYTIIGEVVHGNQLGRTINFPTANIIPDKDKILPPFGVYFTKVIIDGDEQIGITNIGKKPTVSNNDIIGVETNILDFDKDIYGKIIEVQFYKYHRPESKFENLTALKKQIEYDITEFNKYRSEEIKYSNNNI